MTHKNTTDVNNAVTNLQILEFRLHALYIEDNYFTFYDNFNFVKNEQNVKTTQ